MNSWLLNAAKATYFKDSSGDQRTVKAVYFKTYQGIKVQVWPTDFHVEEVYIVRLDNQGYIIGEPIQYTYNITDEIPNIPDLEPNSKYAIYGTIVDGKGNRYEECWYQAYTIESGGIHNDKNVWSNNSSEGIASFISSNKTKSNNVSDDPADLAYTVFMCNDNVDDGDQQYWTPYMGYPVMKDGNDLSNIGTLKDKNYTPVVLRRKSVQQETTIAGYNEEFLEIGDTITLSFSSRKSWEGSSNNWNIEETTLDEWDYDNSVFDASLNNNGTVTFTVKAIPDGNNSIISYGSLEKIIIIAPKYKKMEIHTGGQRFTSSGNSITLYEDTDIAIYATEDINAGDVYTDYSKWDLIPSSEYSVSYDHNGNYVSVSNGKLIMNNLGKEQITIFVNNGTSMYFNCTYALPDSINLSVSAYSNADKTGSIWTSETFEVGGNHSIANLGTIEHNYPFYIDVNTSYNVSVEASISGNATINRADYNYYIIQGAQDAAGTISIFYNDTIVATLNVGTGYTPPEPVYTSKLENLQEHYSDNGTELKPDGSNYAWLTADYNTYKDSILIDSEEVNCSPNFSSTTAAITTSGNNLYWDKEERGQTEQSATSIEVYGSYETFTTDEYVTINLGANTLTINDYDYTLTFDIPDLADSTIPAEGGSYSFNAESSCKESGVWTSGELYTGAAEGIEAVLSVDEGATLNYETTTGNFVGTVTFPDSNLEKVYTFTLSNSGDSITKFYEQDAPTQPEPQFSISRTQWTVGGEGGSTEIIVTSTYPSFDVESDSFWLECKKSTEKSNEVIITAAGPYTLGNRTGHITFTANVDDGPSVVLTVNQVGSISPSE